MPRKYYYEDDVDFDFSIIIFGLVGIGIVITLVEFVIYLVHLMENYADHQLPHNYVAFFYNVTVLMPLKFCWHVIIEFKDVVVSLWQNKLTIFPNLNKVLGVVLILVISLIALSLFVFIVSSIFRLAEKNIDLVRKAIPVICVIFITPLLVSAIFAIFSWLFQVEDASAIGLLYVCP